MRAATPLGNAAGGQNYGRNYTYKNMFFRKYLVLVLLFLWLINCSSFGYISESFHHPLCYWFWWEFWVLLSFRMSAERACWCTHHMQFNYYLLRKGYPESQPFHHFCSLKRLRKLQTHQHVASTVILPMALSFFFFFSWPNPVGQLCGPSTELAFQWPAWTKSYHLRI